MACRVSNDSKLLEDGRSSGGEPVIWQPVAWQACLLAAVVFLTAFFIRLPSCTESLWVDELHSTWTIWGELSEVDACARMGNQTPYFFWFLWCWHQVFGSTEVALRASAAMFVAVGCSALVLGSFRWRGNVWPGVLAGGLLAVERNSLFFGSELRSYAAVIGLSSALLMVAYRCRHNPGMTGRLAIVVTATLLFLTHYTTALLVVGVVSGIVLLPFVSELRNRTRSEAKLLAKTYFIDVCLILIAIAFVLLVERHAIDDLWQRRQQWQAFAVPKPLRWSQSWSVNSMHFFDDVRAMWAWLPMVLLPLGLLSLGRLFGQPMQSRRWLPALAISLAITLAAYGLSAFEIAALWHRRYIIGVLPVLAWCSAELWIAVVDDGRRLLRNRRSWQRLVLPVVFLSAIGSLSFSQGTLQKIARGETTLVRRFEDWRAATKWIEEQQGDADRVLVYAGLIEDDLLGRPDAFSSPQQWDRFRAYLCCPANNLYYVNNTLATSANSPQQIAEQFTTSLPDRSQTTGWWIGRVSWSRHQQIQRDLAPWLRRGLQSSADRGKAFDDDDVSFARFGQISVVRWTCVDDD